MNTTAVEQAITLVKEGATANQAAQQIAPKFNVSPRTIKRWAQNAGTPLGELSQDTAKKAREIQQAEYEARRSAIRVKMLQVAETLLNRIDQEHYDYRGRDANKVYFDVAPSGATKDYVTAAAILLDKIRLEEGKATERSERLSFGAIEQSLQFWADQLGVND